MLCIRMKLQSIIVIVVLCLHEEIAALARIHQKLSALKQVSENTQ